MYYTSSMVRTYQKRGGRISTPPRPKPGLKKPSSVARKTLGHEKESRGARALRWAGILALGCFVAALAFVAGGYVGLVKAVENLHEVSVAPPRPTYIYSQTVRASGGGS